MIKLVHFIHGLNVGGAETLVKNYAMLLDKSKYDVTILCLTRYFSPYERILENAGINVIYISDEIVSTENKNFVSRVFYCIKRYLRIRAHLRVLDPDIVHYHLMLSSYLWFTNLPKRCAILLTVHSDPRRLWCNGRKDRILDFQLVKQLLRRHNMYLIALHEAMRSELMEMFQTARVLQLNNGIDFEPYRRDIDRRAKRKSVHIPEDAFIVTHVGRFNPVKNHLFLVQVFEEIKKRRRKAFLLMIGQGKTELAVQQKLKQMGLDDSYTILHDRMDVPDLLLSSDAAVFPSLVEGLPLTVVEMQAAALPCVASAGVPRSVEISDRIRFLSLDQSPAAWAESLLDLCEISKPVSYKNVEAWDIRANIRQLEEIYEKVIEDRG